MLEIYGRGYLANFLIKYFSSWDGYRIESKNVPFGKITVIRREDEHPIFAGKHFLNLSGPSSIEESVSRRNEYILKPLDQVRMHLEYLSASGGQAKYLFLSSAAVYGNSAYKFASEETELNPVSPYAHGKILIEEFLHQSLSRYSVPVIVIRASSIFSKDLEKRVLFRIKSAIGSHEKLILYGDGTEIRDFIHAKDFFQIVLPLLRIDLANVSSIFNVGSGYPVTMAKLLEIALKASEAKAAPFAYEFNGVVRDFDPKIISIDVSKVTSLVTQPFLNIEDQLFDYFTSK